MTNSFDAHPVTPLRPRRWLALAALLLAEAMNTLDGTIATVAAPRIRTSFAADASTAQWVVAAYTLPFAVLLVLGGRLGDAWGRRRVFVIGLVGFVVASGGCAAARTVALLLLGRALQGAFAALVIPQTIGLIKALFTGPELGRALSYIGPVMGLTAVAGPLVGGALTQADVAGLSWRTVFLVNLPLGALVLATVGTLPEDRAERRPTMDLVGLVLIAAIALGCIVPTVDGVHAGSRSTWLWPGMAVCAAVSLRWHLRRAERRGRDPIVEPSLLRRNGFPAALLTSVLYFAISTGLVFVVSTYLQSECHADALHAGLTVFPFAAGLAVASLIAGQRLVPRYGAALMRPGIALLILGLVGILLGASGVVAGHDSTLLAGMALAGLGGGLTTVPFFTAALSRVRPQETGSAAGLLNAVQQVGSTVGVAVLGTMLSVAGPSVPGLVPPALTALVSAFGLLGTASSMIGRSR